jgi:homoserine dehydrogenase
MCSRVTGACGSDIGAVTVLKFGSSVLANAAGYDFAAHEIEREVGRGRTVVAVVSAMGETTDRLLQTAKSLSAAPAHGLVAQLLSTGEDASVALLGIALTSRGVNAQFLSAQMLGLRTLGPLDDGEPVSCDLERVIDSMSAHDAVVVPGFIGWDPSGVPALLGRGGSDLTALFLARELRAREVRLVKDVDGVYPVDPKRGPAGQLPLTSASWDFVREVGNGVVQEKALRFAEASDLTFRVAAPGGVGTLVGPGGRS